MIATTKLWKQRGLSLKGKVIILNALVGSLLVYRMQVLHTIDKNMVIRLNKIIEDFVWNGRKPKLKLLVLQQSTRQGGMGLFNLILKDKSLKIAWIKRLDQNDQVYNELAWYFIDPKIKQWRIQDFPNGGALFCHKWGGAHPVFR